MIDKIRLKENILKMMDPYYPAEPIVRLIEQLEKGTECSHKGRHIIYDTTMVSKGSSLLTYKSTLNGDIQ